MAQPKSKQQETEAKIARIRKQLEAMREYKKLIASEGLLPDNDDKARESELIVRLLYLEKQLAGPLAKPGPGKAPISPMSNKTARPGQRRRRP